MAELSFWVIWFGVFPVVCALIAMARRLEWWIGALIGVFGCFGVVIVFLIKPGAGAPAVAPPAPGSRWAPDPTGRHELRLWDGTTWTANVSDNGVSGWDPHL